MFNKEKIDLFFIKNKLLLKIIFLIFVIPIFLYIFTIKTALTTNCDYANTQICKITKTLHNHDFFYKYRELNENYEHIKKLNDTKNKQAVDLQKKYLDLPESIYMKNIDKKMGQIEFHAKFPDLYLENLIDVNIKNSSQDDEKLSSFIKPFLIGEIQDVWIDTTSKVIFLAQGNQNITQSPEYFTITKINYEYVTNTSNINSSSYRIKNKEIIFQKRLVPNYQLNILDYYPENNTLVFDTNYGDGCGGHNEVYILNINTKQTKLVDKFGSGCTDGNRFGGLYKRQIVGVSIDPNVKYKFAGDKKLKKLYLINPITFKKTFLPLDLEPFKFIYLEENYSNKIVFSVSTESDGKREKFKYNLQTNKLEKLN